MKLSDFDFDLPQSAIAQHPLSTRDAARLLHVSQQGLADLRVHDLPRLLRRGDVMVFNDTRVIPARLLGRRGSSRIEVTLHLQEGAAHWKAFARPARRLQPGDRLDFAEDLSAEVTGKGDGGEVSLQFTAAGSALLALLERYGQMPLPPYIRRPEGPDARDRENYQTIYAARSGAVAAPTAGLHFTRRLLQALDEAGIIRAVATLHVGAGTFLPVRTEDVEDHRMHAEWGSLDAATVARIEAARAAGGRVVAVGTTALRLLESAADEHGRLAPFEGETSLYILPGYRFRCVDLLMTNFHLPKSTLFMLVCAFAGQDRMKAAYAHAIETGYRFYSYGDASLLERSR